MLKSREKQGEKSLMKILNKQMDKHMKKKKNTLLKEKT